MFTQWLHHLQLTQTWTRAVHINALTSSDTFPFHFLFFGPLCYFTICLFWRKIRKLFHLYCPRRNSLWHHFPTCAYTCRQNHSQGQHWHTYTHSPLETYTTIHRHTPTGGLISSASMLQTSCFDSPINNLPPVCPQCPETWKRVHMLNLILKAKFNVNIFSHYWYFCAQLFPKAINQRQG